jgi:hypothetical protein
LSTACSKGDKTMFHTFLTLLSYSKWFFLVAYVVYAFVATNKNKPLSWMLAHIATVLAGGVACYFQYFPYMGFGLVMGVATLVQQLVGGKFTAGNILAALKTTGTNLLFYPVSLFEGLYNSVVNQKPVA